MDQRTTNRERATTGFKSLILLIVICIFLFIIGMIGTWIWTDKPNEFGDSAGVVNALFQLWHLPELFMLLFYKKKSWKIRDKL